MNAFDTLLLGNSPELYSVMRSAQIAAATDVSVLILGESGTGKELLAQALHQESHRGDAPFIAINCAAMPEQLAESELFGHCKGAFTGATANSPGRIRAAKGGTLLLDEIAELPLNIQAKLLRFLESGECQSLGDTTPTTVDVRIIAATHRDLYQMVQEGRFRADLYYRLNVVPLELPPLRRRRGDVALLLQALSTQLAEKHDLQAPSFSDRVITQLETHSWPGNIRELKNFCERMLILNAGSEINLEHLPVDMFTNNHRRNDDGFTLPDDGIRLEELEQEMIKQALDRTHGNRTRAARLLGLTRDTLLYRIKKYTLGR
ncbi:MAG: sigma-54 dependent transcriptional regulator [Pseudomonadota bacterium]